MIINMLSKINNYLLWIFLFLLPWQTRWIWHLGQLNGGAWEYGTFSLYGTEILLWLVVILFVVEKIKEKKFKINWLLAIILILFFALLVALSLNHQISFQFVLHVLEGLCIFFVLANSGKKLMFALWLGGIPQGILALYQFFNQHVFASKWLGMAEQLGKQGGASVIEFADQRWLRAYGSFGSPNSLGIYLAVILLIGLILYLRENNLKLRIILSIGQLVILAGLILSFSRGAWLTTIVGLVTLLIIIYKREKIELFNFSKQVTFYILLAVFFLAIFYPVFMARFNFNNRLEHKSIYEREIQYNEALSLINPARILFGVGPGTFTYALYQKNVTLPSYQYQPVHNVYVLILVEWGLVGVIIFLIFHIKLLEKISKNNLIYLPVIISLLCAGLFDHWLWSMWTGVVFWFVVWRFGSTKQMENNPVGNS